MNSPPQLLALTFLAAFFVAVGWQVRLILRTAPCDPASKGPRLFLGLAAASFAITWFYMSKFVAWSFNDYEASAVLAGGYAPENELFHTRVANWLLNTSLFEQAWENICFGTAWSWWWNQQLCLFTAGAWTIFLTIEGNKYKIKHLWAYMLLGQMLTISVGANLFFYAVASARPPAHTPPAHASPLLWTTVPLALATAFSTPWARGPAFGPVLTAMHVLLFVPLVWRTDAPAQRLGASVGSTRAFLRTVALATLGMHLYATYAACASLAPPERSVAGALGAARAALYSHPAQTSVAYDAICVALSCAAWTVYRGGPRAGGALGRAVRFVLRTLVGSPAYAAVAAELDLLE